MARKTKQVYNVEKILRHRVSKRQQSGQSYFHIELFVKWEGYSEADNTWEPLYVMIQDVPTLVKTYLRKARQELVGKCLVRLSCFRIPGSYEKNAV